MSSFKVILTSFSFKTDESATSLVASWISFFTCSYHVKISHRCQKHCKESAEMFSCKMGMVSVSARETLRNT